MKDNSFSKECSNMIKGIVIIMMLFHHLFRVPELYDGYQINFYPFSEELVNNVTTYFKLCVGTFAFLSGYGLSISYKNSSDSNKKFFLSRYIKTFQGYWFIFIISSIVCQLLDGLTINTYFSNGNIINNLMNYVISFLGISHIFSLKQLCYEWWYMSAYVIFILLVPLLCDYEKRYGETSLIVSLMMIFRLFNLEFLGGTWPSSFLMPVILGIVFQSKDLFNLIEKAFEKDTTKYIVLRKTLWGALLLFVSYKLYGSLHFQTYWEIKYGVVPVLAVIAFYMIYTIIPKSINKVFQFFGIHSMNMYLIHTIFLRYAKSIIYNMPNFILSGIFFIIVSLIISLVVEKIKICIRYEKLIENISKILIKE